MASRLFNQFLASLNFNPVFIEGSFQIGSTGAPVVSSFTGAGIMATSTLTVQKLGTGLYMLQLNDDYNRIVGWNFMPMPGPSSSVAQDNNGNIVLGKPYQILGGTSALAGPNPSTSTNWYTLGLNPSLNPVVGQVFVATSGASNTPGSSSYAPGQGLVQALGISTIGSIQALPCVNTALAPTSTLGNATGGAQLYFQTLGSSLTRIDPSTSTVRYNLILRNSSRMGYNEASTSN